MHTLQRILGTTLLVLLVACGSGTGATGVDDVQSDSADVQIAPQDTQDAVPGTDAVLDVTDVAQPKDIWIDSDVPPIDVPPADIADIQADIAPDIAVDIGVDTGDAFVAENCNGGFGGNGMCTNGLVCWAAPCPKCGMMPQGWCLPPLENGACYDYTTCDGGACYPATPMNGVSGWCLPAIATAGQCWGNASSLTPDCVSGNTCEGQFVCPPMGACPMADKPGTCTASPEQKGKVYLWERSGGIVSPGETVTVTWVNYTGASVFLPGCATYNIQTTSDYTTWKDLGPGVMCAWEGVAVEVPAGGYVNTLSWTAPNNGIGNYRFHGSYSVGCTPGKALSQANCTGSSEIDSDTFFVGMVP